MGAVQGRHAPNLDILPSYNILVVMLQPPSTIDISSQASIKTNLITEILTTLKILVKFMSFVAPIG